MNEKDMRTLIGWIIDNRPVMVADILMDKKPYIRDLELFIRDNPDCICALGLKISGGVVQVLDFTVTKKYLNKR